MSSSALRELFASFGIEVLGGEQLDKADKKLDSLFAKVKQFATVAAEGFAVRQVEQFIEGQIVAGAALKVTAERLGTTTDELQAFDLAAGEAGVGAESMNVALRFLNRNIGEAVQGNGEATKAFASLGIQFKNVDGTSRTAGDVIGELADKIAATKDPAKATNLAMQLLGRGGAELVPILLKGGDAFRQAREQMQALGGGMSKEFVQQAHEAQAANVRLSFALTGLKSTIAFATLPYVDKLVSWLTKVTVETKEFAEHTTILTTGLDALALIAGVKVAGSIVGLVSKMGLLKPSVLETVAALFEFAAPALVIGALYLLVDDLWNLFTGGKSVIGDDIDALFGFGASKTFVEDVTAAFQDTVDVVGDLATILTQTLVAAFQTVWQEGQGVGNALGDIFTGNWGNVKNDLAAGNAAASDAIQKAGARIGTAGADLFGQNGTHLGAMLAKRKATKEQQDFDTNLANSPIGDNTTTWADDPGPGHVDVGPIDFGGGKGRARKPQGSVAVGPIAFGPSDRPQTVYASSAARYDTGAAPTPSAAAAAPIVIHQQNDTKVEVHTSSDRPDDVGKATGQGVSTSQQRNNNNALASVSRP